MVRCVVSELMGPQPLLAARGVGIRQLSFRLGFGDPSFLCESVNPTVFQFKKNKKQTNKNEHRSTKSEEGHTQVTTANAWTGTQDKKRAQSGYGTEFRP